MTAGHPGLDALTATAWAVSRTARSGVRLSGTALPELLMQLTIWSPLQGLATAAVGVVVVVLFRDWLAIRIEP